MAEHTPGPWEVGFQALDVIAPNVAHGPMKVCDIRGWAYLTGGGHGALGLPHDEAKSIQEANARLIAAAPDMRGTLLEIINECESATAADGEVLRYIVAKKARAAIAKATAPTGSKP